MNVLEKAKVRIDELQKSVLQLRQQRDEIEKKLASTELDIARLAGFIETYRQLEDATENSNYFIYGGTTTGQRQSPARAFVGRKNIEVIVEAYLKEAAPKKTGEIVAYLQSKGCIVPSEQKEPYVAGILSRSDKFVARRKLGGWFLKANDPEPHSPREAEQLSLSDYIRVRLRNQAAHKGETPSVPAEGVSDTSNQAAVRGGTESDD